MRLICTINTFEINDAAKSQSRPLVPRRPALDTVYYLHCSEILHVAFRKVCIHKYKHVSKCSDGENPNKGFILLKTHEDKKHWRTEQI